MSYQVQATVGAAVAGIKNVLRSRRNSKEGIPDLEKEKEKEKAPRTTSSTPSNKSDALVSKPRRHSSDERSVVRGVRTEESSSCSLNSTFSKNGTSDLV